MKRSNLLVLVLLVLSPYLCAVCHGAEATKEYTDPDGAFALRIPTKWEAKRGRLGDGGWLTEIGTGKEEAPKVSVIVFPSKHELAPEMLEGLGELLITLVLQGIREEGAVLTTKLSPAKLREHDAMRSDITFRVGEKGKVQQGYMLSVLGQKTALLVGATAPQTDTQGFKQAEAALLSFTFAAPLPAVDGAASSSMFNTTMLSLLTDKFKGHLKREAKNTVLVAGEPPLTYGSVAAFVTFVSRVFDLEFTESEFEITRQRFIDYYQKADADGKRLLAEGGQGLLAQVEEGTAEQQAANRREAKQGMGPRLAAAAKAGLGWAVVLNEVIQRRAHSLETIEAAKPEFAQKSGFDNDLSEADLDASLEMLYFMWVAAGRDARLVTPEAMAAVRPSLVQNFAQSPPQLQYILANGQKVYAGLRTAWSTANAEQQTQMAQRFNVALDAMGLTVPKPRANGESVSAWSDWKGKTNGDFTAAMVVGLANSSYHAAW